MLERLRHPAWRIPLLYLLVALPWVFLTDLLVRTATPSVEVENLLASIKGIGFVLATTALLYFGIRSTMASIVDAREVAEENEARFRALVSSLDDLVFMTDLDQRFTELLGPATTREDRARFIGKTGSEVFGQDVGRAYMQMGERVLAGETFYVDWFRETAPMSFPVSNSVTSMRIALAPLRDADGSIAGVVGIGRDTSRLHDLEREREQAQGHISFLVNYDTLTGLPNRTLLGSRLAEAISVAERDGHPVAVYILNVDDFKDVNDSLGYEVGDELLKAIAERLRAVVDSQDALARLAGDEFAIVRRVDSEHSGAEGFAREILGTFETPVAAAGQEIYLTAAIGIALYPDDGDSPDLLLRAADTAMYDAKSGRDTGYARFHAGMADESRERLALANDLRRALEQDELSVAYQPIVSAVDGRVVAFEALARWQSPTRGSVPPGVFIPVAERVGLVDDVGRVIRLHAYAWLLRCHAAGYTDLQIEVNVSPLHFRRGSIARLVEETQMAGIDPRHVVLEITESALVDVRGSVEHLIAELRTYGFGLAVDDFGTGYSSLTYLARLPVTVLKIAQEFVQGIGIEGNRVVIETALSIARRLGYQTIAEGVEREDEARFLLEAGVDCYQGFLHGRPVPPDEALRFLQENRASV